MRKRSKVWLKNIINIAMLKLIHFVFDICHQHRTDRTMWLVQFWENISKLYQRSAKVKLERNTWMSVLCWTSLCYDLRLQNLANDAFPRDIELVDHRIMLSAVTKGFRHLLTWPFSRSELFLEICVQICSNLNSHLEGLQLELYNMIYTFKRVHSLYLKQLWLFCPSALLLSPIFLYSFRWF